MHPLQAVRFFAGVAAFALLARAEDTSPIERTPLLPEQDRLAPVVPPRLDLIPPPPPAPFDLKQVDPRLPSLSAPRAIVPPVPLAFFPPVAPPFEAPVPETARMTRINGIPLLAPGGLADYVGENFYAPLGTRLIAGTLSAAQAERLKHYTARRNALVRELRDVLETLHFADAATREEHLRAFARTQTPRIAALEVEAERVRREILQGKLLSPSIDWNEDRVWHLGQTGRINPIVAASGEHQVVRAAAYYQDGLGVEQRWLLREIAMELHEDLLAKTGRPRSNDTVFAMFFSPGTVRFRLPEKIPGELKAEIGAYNGARLALKTELRETLVQLDPEKSDAKRAAALAALSERQWPHLMALEEKAEVIRRAIEALPPPAPPRLPPPIPKELLAKIEAYQQDRRAFDAERRTQPQKIGYIPLRIDTPPNATPEESREAMRQAHDRRDARRRELLDEFERENSTRLAQLNARASALWREVEDFADVWVDPHTGKRTTAVVILRSFDLAHRAFAQLGRRETIYREYRVAMLQPGLSPEQRRLLFSAVLAGLAQPLPGGEPLPRKGQRTPTGRI